VEIPEALRRRLLTAHFRPAHRCKFSKNLAPFRLESGLENEQLSAFHRLD